MKRKNAGIMYVTLGVVVVLVIGIVTFLNHPQFGRNPTGARLARIEKSANFCDGE